MKLKGPKMAPKNEYLRAFAEGLCTGTHHVIRLHEELYASPRVAFVFSIIYPFYHHRWLKSESYPCIVPSNLTNLQETKNYAKKRSKEAKKGYWRGR